MSLSELWRRVVALSDPQLTANFQNLCGVRSVRGSQPNGVDSGRKAAQPTSSTTVECNGSCIANCQNGDAHSAKNGSLQCQNGSTNLFDAAVKKRHGHTNGVITRTGVQNGIQPISAVHLQNGIACQYQHDHCIPAVNGIIHNGDIPKSVNDDTVKNSKQQPTHVIDNKLFYYVFCFGANLGNEIFYILFFSCGLWNFDCGISRKISFIWCVIMYIGQVAKDLICWPRPTSPPSIRLEGRYELEFGMPSTHAMVGVVIPFAVLYYTYGVYEYNLTVALVFAVMWCILVSCSRLYMGMHSVLDILAGIVGAVIILVCCIPFVDMVDCLLLAHPWCFPGLNIVGIGLCLAYPELKIWSTARGDTTQVMAVFSGIYQGLWYMTKVTTPEMAAAATLSAPTGWAAVAAAFGRQLMGVVVLVAVLESLKKAVIYVAATLQGMDPRNPTCKQHLGVELPYKYIGYYVPSFCAGYVMPVFFQMLGWHRGNFLHEVLTHSHHFGL